MFDEKIRYKYNLNENSIVFDIGAYLGGFTKIIFNKYHCNIYTFEPVLSFFEGMKRKFNNNKIKLFNFGLLNRDFETEMKNQGISSSLFHDSNEGEKVVIKDILKFLKENNIKKVDLIKINIEGGEYDLMNHILDNGDITIFKNIQIQYHFRKDKRQNCYLNAKDLIKNITEKLKETHFQDWWFPQWESWKIK